jgi:hypothetical protein
LNPAEPIRAPRFFFRGALAEVGQRSNLNLQHILDMLYSVLPFYSVALGVCPGARLAKEAARVILETPFAGLHHK